MAKTVKLLLVENVDNLGIVGDLVNVKLGYARNYLLPRGLATEPSNELLGELAERRAEAEREQARLRQNRESMIGKLEGLEVSLQRSCNDQGILYGSVTQNDLSEALNEAGYEVKPREIRLSQTIKRIGEYDVHVKLDTDLECDVHLVVNPDRELDLGGGEDFEFDNEGNLIERRAPEPDAAPGTPAAEGQGPGEAARGG